MSVSGLVILSGYFLHLTTLANLRTVLLNWAVILAGVALLIGLINLTLVHLRKVINREPNAIYSVVMLMSLFVTMGVGAIYGPTSRWSLWIFNHIQVPIETSLLALLAIILIVAIIRLLYRRPSGFSMVFIFTVLIVLLGSVTIPWLNVSFLSEARLWINRVPIVGGARGILLGVVLGTIATGLRVFMGADRPYEN